MTLQQALNIKGEVPARPAKFRGGSPRLKTLYDFTVAHFDEIVEAQRLGYSWTQLGKALDEVAKREGIEEKYGGSEFSAMFSFVRKEREIKGVA